MSTVTTDINRPIAQVWCGVVNANAYPDWLIGAQNVDVPDAWPECGTSFEHSQGFGPFQLPGSTTTLVVTEPSLFRIGAGIGPFGEAEVTFELEAITPEATRVTMIETPSDGAIAFLKRIAAPLVERTIRIRNTKSLDQLREILERQP